MQEDKNRGESGENDVIEREEKQGKKRNGKGIKSKLLMLWS